MMFCARCICVLEIDLARRRAVQPVSACSSCVFLYAACVCCCFSRVAGSSWARVLLLGSCVSFCVSSYAVVAVVMSRVVSVCCLVDVSFWCCFMDGHVLCSL